ncbi:hypothetical protein CLV48_1185 [Cecembia rubra]|uniref:Uncharacterized protein n=1 Tax=Cecembia rubra TaxID=1485585 RepID=A0A2P8DNC3_9BACT|nr:hypothetical protein CLV48_1185 [Cecembia rubra]
MLVDFSIKRRDIKIIRKSQERRLKAEMVFGAFVLTDTVQNKDNLTTMTTIHK